jgi:hypothetical protein
MPDCKSCKKLRRKLKRAQVDANAMRIVAGEYQAQLYEERLDSYWRRSVLEYWVNSWREAFGGWKSSFNKRQRLRRFWPALWNLLTSRVW